MKKKSSYLPNDVVDYIALGTLSNVVIQVARWEIVRGTFFYMYGGVPFRGNADEWYYQVYITPGWESSNTPPYTSQNIGWHERGDMGHVAYITSHTSTVVSGSEQNWCQAGCPSRFYSRSASFFEKYLYRIRDIIPTSTLLIID